jgi:hypothetical protein
MKTLFSVLACSLFLNTAIASAQVEIVQAVKADLVSRHVSLAGPCGAFEITKRVAWALRSQGLGLLSKPGGNNCQGYATDFLVRPDASGIDILGDSGGDNVPGWSESEPPGALAGRWREPFDPGDTVVTPPAPPQPPTSTLEQQIYDLLVAHEDAEQAERAKAEAFRQSVKSTWESFKPALTFVGKYIVPAIGAWLVGKKVG